MQLTFHNVLRDWMWLRSQGPHEHRTKLPVCRQRACRATGQPRGGGGEKGRAAPPPITQRLAMRVWSWSGKRFLFLTWIIKWSLGGYMENRCEDETVCLIGVGFVYVYI